MSNWGWKETDNHPHKSIIDTLSQASREGRLISHKSAAVQRDKATDKVKTSKEYSGGKNMFWDTPAVHVHLYHAAVG